VAWWLVRTPITVPEGVSPNLSPFSVTWEFAGSASAEFNARGRVPDCREWGVD